MTLTQTKISATSETIEETTGELLNVLPLLTRIVASEVRREAGNDTTMPQFRVLGHLLESPLTLSVLARRRRVSLQSMGELVQTLVERGWLERNPDPTDRRQQLIALTTAGRRHFVRAESKTMQRLMPLIANLTKEELAAVQIALAGLHRVLVTDEDPLDPKSPEESKSEV